MQRMLILFLMFFGVANAAQDCREIQDAESRTACEVNARINGATMQWAHSTRIDPITDEATCVVRHESATPGYPVISFGRGIVFAWPDGDRVPGSIVAMRVDQRPAQRGMEWIVDHAARALVADMRSGSTIATQFTQWPSGLLINATAPLTGISAQFDACLAELASARAQ